MTANTLIGLILSAVGAAFVLRLCPKAEPKTVKPVHPQFVGGSLDGEFYLRGCGEWFGYVEHLPSGALEFYQWDFGSRWVFKGYLPQDTSDTRLMFLCFGYVECSGTGNRSGK